MDYSGLLIAFVIALLIALLLSLLLDDGEEGNGDDFDDWQGGE